MSRLPIQVVIGQEDNAQGEGDKGQVFEGKSVY
jgi:hypothetical protein